MRYPRDASGKLELKALFCETVNWLDNVYMYGNPYICNPFVKFVGLSVYLMNNGTFVTVGNVL